eukprot:CAMPEP_0114600102 /NCGR_PEP_ID=MMETSP0125-20121206/22652_1 /TAXON_ID=485358 ORGANISM="Aristerostoma sp., Strain ATCC 50986" /NCGR_SAMPLE_ID=MMETSP0125 /ASSEMBLY_ACC=CAM_ASM_000245 /LENGTH=102 /DNA_ID=CAMNT_0001807857 /DNA_START=213 /DNA_END=518 /DNA_ORIENTATION=-
MLLKERETERIKKFREAIVPPQKSTNRSPEKSIIAPSDVTDKTIEDINNLSMVLNRNTAKQKNELIRMKMQAASRSVSAVSDYQSSFMDVNPFLNNLKDLDK